MVTNKKDEALKLALEGAANYIDALGGDSRKYRQALAEQPAQPEQGYTTTRNAWTGKATHRCNVCRRDDFRSEHAAKFHTCEALTEQPAQQQEPATVVGAIPMGHNQKDMPFAHVDHLPIGTKLYTSPQPSKPWVGLVHEETHEAIGTAGADLLELAKLWSDNKVHVYQFDNEARKIIEAVLRRASAKLREKNA